MGKNLSKIYALAIIAHPDDESFLFAGTTMKFEEEEKTVAVICATHGEKGADRLNRKLTEDQMSEIRTRELYRACSILQCDCKKFFSHPDGNLEQMDFGKLVLELIETINAYNPKVILTFGSEGISGHKDHITIGKAAVEASKKADPKPSEIWLASIPSSLIDSFQEHLEQRKVHRLHYVKNSLQGVADEKLTKINISKYKDKKLNAIKAHESQYLPHLVWEGFLKQECFEVIKP